jgi:hypothetical protein
MSQLTHTFTIVAVLGFVAWFYYQKYLDLQYEFNKLHHAYADACKERLMTEHRIKDLQTYKNDVAKTFQILDNELVMINEHIKRQSDGQPHALNSIVLPTINHLATDHLATELFSSINQERPTVEETQALQPPFDSPNVDTLAFTPAVGGYDQFLMEEADDKVDA